MLDNEQDKKDGEQEGSEKKPENPVTKPLPAPKPKPPVTLPPAPIQNAQQPKEAEKLEKLAPEQLPVAQLARILKESGVLDAFRNSFAKSNDAPQLDYAQNSKDIISWINSRIEMGDPENQDKIDQLQLKFARLEKIITGPNCAQAALWVKKHFPTTESTYLEAYRIAAHVEGVQFTEDLWKMDFVPKYPEILSKKFSIDGKLSPSAAFIASLSNVHLIPDDRLKELCELTYSTFPEIRRSSPEALLILTGLSTPVSIVVNDGRIEKELVALRSQVNILRDDFGFSSVNGADIVRLIQVTMLDKSFLKQLTPEAGKTWKQVQTEFPQLYNRDLQDLLSQESDARKHLRIFDSLRIRTGAYPKEALSLVRAFGREPREIQVEEWNELGGGTLPVPLETIIAQPLFSNYSEMALKKFKGVSPPMDQLFSLAENFLGYEVAHTKGDLSQTLAIRYSVKDFALSGGLFKLFRDGGMERVTYNFTNHLAHEMSGAKLSLQDAASGVVALLNKGMGPQFQEVYRIFVEELGMKEVPLPNLLMVVSNPENLGFLLNKTNRENYKETLTQVAAATNSLPGQGDNFNVETMKGVLARREEFLAELPRLKKLVFAPEFTAGDGIESFFLFTKGNTSFSEVTNAIELVGKQIGSTDPKDYVMVALAAAGSADDWIERINAPETKSLWDLVLSNLDQSEASESERVLARMNTATSIVSMENPKDALTLLSQASAAGMLVFTDDLNRNLTELKQISEWLAEPEIKAWILSQRDQEEPITFESMSSEHRSIKMRKNMAAEAAAKPQ